MGHRGAAAEPAVNGLAADAVALGDLDHGWGLGRHHWVMERISLDCTSSHQFTRLQIRWQYRADIPRGIPQAGMLPYLLVVILLAVLTAHFGMRSGVLGTDCCEQMTSGGGWAAG
jgi:hypothetical protein